MLYMCIKLDVLTYIDIHVNYIRTFLFPYHISLLLAVLMRLGWYVHLYESEESNRFLHSFPLFQKLILLFKLFETLNNFVYLAVVSFVIYCQQFIWIFFVKAAAGWMNATGWCTYIFMSMYVCKCVHIYIYIYNI